MSNIGCRIFTEIKRPDKELIDQFRGLPVANIGDNMNRIYCVDSNIKSMNGQSLVGTAFTLHLPSGDNLLLHKAMELAKPGDVLVVACGGMERSYCGELMMMYARNKGIAGFVIDGCIRDIDECEQLDNFPVFAKGVMPQGPYKHGPGEINVPIAVGGQVVFPGDIVVGDRDGLVFVHQKEAEDVLKKAIAQNNKENKLKEIYEKGGLQPSFSEELREETLAKLSCEVIEGCFEF
ncbi:RraA family protein [Intestinibacter sp.]|uniref:RraA family protein n=1 Tax=Intestinibacter sp. TaxID=1965304 RepID=UPI003F18D93E